MSLLLTHLGLFGIAFLAATILPGSSEAALVGMAVLKPEDTVTLFLVATCGNTLGAIVNWLLGRWLMRFAGHRWFPAASSRIDRASAFIGKYGSWPLVFSWLPVVGDPMTVAAGTLRVRFPPFLAFVTIGKALRYAAVLAGLELFRSTI